MYLSRDEVFEILILRYTDYITLPEAIAGVIGREPTIEEIKEFDSKVEAMRRGWVQMNLNIRKLGKQDGK